MSNEQQIAQLQREERAGVLVRLTAVIIAGVVIMLVII